MKKPIQAMTVLMCSLVSVHPSKADERCARYRAVNGIYLTARGPVGPVAAPRSFASTDQALLTVANELATECAGSSSAHVQRANLLLFLGNKDAAVAALNTALRLDSDWSASDKRAAQRNLGALTRVRANGSTGPREQAANALTDDTMWIPGVTDGGGLGFGAGGGFGFDIPQPDLSLTTGGPASAPAPQPGDAWIPYAIGGVIGTLAGGGIGWGICYAAGCFTPQPAPGTSVRWTPSPSGARPTAPWPPPLRIVQSNNDSDYLLHVQLFAALKLPPVDDANPVQLLPPPVVSSCDAYVRMVNSLLGPDHFGVTTVRRTTQSNGAVVKTADGRTCILWTGWAQFQVSYTSQCVPLAPNNASSAACQTFVSQWNEGCARHEAQHLRDLKNALGNGPPLSTQVCASGTNLDAQAMRALQEQWESHWRNDLVAIIDQASRQLHLTPDGIPLSLGSQFCDQCFNRNGIVTLPIRTIGVDANDVVTDTPPQETGAPFIIAPHQ